MRVSSRRQMVVLGEKSRTRTLGLGVECNGAGVPERVTVAPVSGGPEVELLVEDVHRIAAALERIERDAHPIGGARVWTAGVCPDHGFLGESQIAPRLSSDCQECALAANASRIPGTVVNAEDF